MEFGYTNNDEVFVKNMIATICSLLKGEKIQIGSKTNSGLGAIILEDEKLYEFNFSKKTDVFYWLTQSMSEKNRIEPKSLGTPFQIKTRYFTIDVTFQLKNSLIIRSYSDDPEMPDAVHIQSLNDPVLTGTSLKGAIRARAERIVNTLGKSDSIVKELFGNVEDETRSKDAKKGKIQVKECILPKFISELQTRIKIDRFTGGTIESALFDTMPLFSDFKENVKNISACVRDCKDYEAGLLLLVLKDLWTGDLAIGGEKNIGRGVFQGVNAFITFDSEEFFIEKDLSRLLPDIRDKLQHYVKALAEK
jgi:CRISPR/Cas system CSM-associated protein Csm3 (group 7 of RAMP superfamily)